MNTRTLTAVVGLLLVGASLAVGGAAAADDAQLTQSERVETAQQGNLTFDSQATASSTVLEEGPTSPGVVLQDVDTDVDSTVFVTYPEPGLQAGDEVTVDLDNFGASYWEVNGVSGDADSIDQVVADGGNNPTLRFVEGVRYTFTDLPGSAHPLEFNNANDDPLLSQGEEIVGEFEDDPDVEWVDSGNSVAFTVTPALSAELATYICTIHANMEGDVQTTSETQTDQVVAGVAARDAGTSGAVQIPVEDTGGFPGTHTAYLVPNSSLSENYTPGDVLSNETTSSAIASEQATVFQSTLAFENQTVDGPIRAGDTLGTLQTATLLDGAGNDTEFAVYVHPRGDSGAVAGAEFVGSSDVVSGTNTNVTVTAERVPEDGEFNRLPLTGVNDLVAVVHRVDDGASVGDPSPPGEYPQLLHGRPSEAALYGVSDGGTVTTAEANGSVDFDDQATASSTFTDSDPSAPGVVVNSVESNVETAVVVTYTDESAGGTGLVVAGVETFAAGALNGGNVAVPVEETGGFPGPHTAHLIPAADLSGSYTPGDVVSNKTAGNALDSEQATLFQGTLTFENQTFPQQVFEGDTLAILPVASLTGGDAAFTVDVHPVDQDGDLLGASYVGSSAVLTGENTNVTVTAEQSGESVFENEFPLTGVNDLVAMLHLVDDNTSAGEPATPGQYPALPHASAGGPVSGGVTDAAVLELPVVQDLRFPDQSLSIDDTVTVEGVRSDGVESAVIVTYPDGGSRTVAGLTTGTYSNESVEVGIEDTGGFPGSHTAHIVPIANLSGEYAPGDTVSNETAGNILAQATANVTDDVPAQSLTFEDQFVDDGTVTVESAQSSRVESAILVTYPGDSGLVVAGLTVGTFDDESVEVPIENASGLQSVHTAHIIPAEDLSKEYQPGDLVSVETAGNVSDQQTATVQIDIGDNNQAPADTTGDGRLNDVDGVDGFSIFDVQAFFTSFNSDPVQANPVLFNFDGKSPESPEVSIFDVQALFTELGSQAD